MTSADGSISKDNAGGDGSGNRDGGHFGTYLKAQREACGVTLQQVAERTNIQPEILVHIETERLDQLPEPVYIKGFLRAFADAVGADPREAVLRYERHDAAYRQALSARQLRGRRRLQRRMLLGALAVAGVLFAVAALLPEAPEPGGQGGGQAASPAAEGALEGRAAAVGEGAAGEVPVAGSAGRAAETAASVDQPLMLSAVGLKEATLKIIVDGKRPKVYRLKADTRLEIEARREFNILMDDARAVTLYLNGQPVTVPGREGQQVTLQLP